MYTYKYIYIHTHAQMCPIGSSAWSERKSSAPTVQIIHYP